MTTNPEPSVEEGDPGVWMGTSPLLDLEDTKLRLRAQALTQLCKSEREKVLALYAFVKRIPFAKAFKTRLHTAREVLQQGHGDSADKATLLVALLRLAGVPARLRYLTLDAAVMRGLIDQYVEPTRPVVEAWLDGRWAATDSYIFDGPYAAAAVQRLRARGWDRGYGIHVDGQLMWDGRGDAYVGGHAPADDPMLVHDHGVYCDPLEFISSESYREAHARISRAVRWHLIAPGMDRAIRELRDHAHRLRRIPAAA